MRGFDFLFAIVFLALRLALRGATRVALAAHAARSPRA
jgi:hypothetical protein